MDRQNSPPVHAQMFREIYNFKTRYLCTCNSFMRQGWEVSSRYWCSNREDAQAKSLVCLATSEVYFIGQTCLPTRTLTPTTRTHAHLRIFYTDTSTPQNILDIRHKHTPEYSTQTQAYFRILYTDTSTPQNTLHRHKHTSEYSTQTQAHLRIYLT